MNPSKTNIVVGPPGTGKTTRLIGIVEELLTSRKAKPQEICYIAFTRKAATVARDRTIEKLKLDIDDLPYFRTLHSLAFQELQLVRKQVMNFGDYCNLAHILGISITKTRVSEDGMITGMTKGDRLFFTEGLARVKGLTVRELWEDLPEEDLDVFELEQLAETLAAYKEINDKLDFTDMINMWNKQQPIPDVKYLIVDEAQDLSKTQWVMVNSIAEKVEEVYLAGDDDQAIYRWAGADVETFIDMEGTVETLAHSYRLPDSIKEISDKIIGNIQHRREKIWTGSGARGGVHYVNSLEEVDMSKGTWLCLARNMYLLEAYNSYCQQNGWVFSSTAGSPIQSDSLAAIRDWEYLRRGDKVTASRCRNTYAYMSVNRGVKYGSKKKLDEVEDKTMLSMTDLCNKYGCVAHEAWHKSLDKLTDDEREYFKLAIKRGEKLLREPRIKISTIHGVKGDEAENVIIFLDMAVRTFNEYMASPDDEMRVWYVAVTRAKTNVYIVNPMTNRHFLDI